MRRMMKHQAVSKPVEKLNWDISVKPVSIESKIASGYKGIIRDDNGDVFSIVKKSYYPVTISDHERITHEMAELTGFEIKGYSTIREGRQVLSYLQNNDENEIAGFKSRNYMVLGNSFDKSTGFFIGESDLLFRCSNEFGHLSRKHNIRHASNAKNEMQNVIKMYQDYIHKMKETRSKYEVWCGIQVPAELHDLFIERTLEVDTEKKISTRTENKMKDLASSINREVGEMGNNAFGLFNGITHYTTHVLSSKNKIHGNVFGMGADMNAKAEIIIEDMITEFSLN